MAEMQQQAIGGSHPIQERSFQEKMLETFQHETRGSDLDLKTALLKARSRVGAMANSNMQETLSPPMYYQTQIRPLEGHRTQWLGSPMCTGMREKQFKRGVCPPHGRWGQTNGYENMANEFFDGHGDAVDGDQIDGYRFSVLSARVITWAPRLYTRTSGK